MRLHDWSRRGCPTRSMVAHCTCAVKQSRGQFGKIIAPEMSPHAIMEPRHRDNHLMTVTTTRAAERGSQLWIQRAVERRDKVLERSLANAVGRPNTEVRWKAPLGPRYAEPRDGRVFELLGINPPHRSLKDFWPRRGPVWDSIAVIDDQFVLIEAKAHIGELISGGTKAQGESLGLIDRSLERARKSLAPRSKVNWAQSPFFQYANRLAFLQFLREDNKIPAHVVFLYFTHDSVMGGPDSAEEWQGAIRLMEASLGLSSHKLTPFVHKIFLDSRGLTPAIA